MMQGTSNVYITKVKIYRDYRKCQSDVLNLMEKLKTHDWFVCKKAHKRYQFGRIFDKNLLIVFK